MHFKNTEMGKNKSSVSERWNKSIYNPIPELILEILLIKTEEGVWHIAEITIKERKGGIMLIPQMFTVSNRNQDKRKGGKEGHLTILLTQFPVLASVKISWVLKIINLLELYFWEPCSPQVKLGPFRGKKNICHGYKIIIFSLPISWRKGKFSFLLICSFS